MGASSNWSCFPPTLQCSCPNNRNQVTGPSILRDNRFSGRGVGGNRFGTDLEPSFPPYGRLLSALREGGGFPMSSLEPIWNRFGTDLEPISNRFGTDLEPPPKCGLQPIWNPPLSLRESWPVCWEENTCKVETRTGPEGKGGLSVRKEIWQLGRLLSTKLISTCRRSRAEHSETRLRLLRPLGQRCTESGVSAKVWQQKVGATTVLLLA